MSVYKASNPDTLSNEKKVRDYILNINKSIQNLFNSVDPEDNFTEEELNRYRGIDDTISALEVNIQKFGVYFEDTKSEISSEIGQQKNQVSMKVRKGDLINQLNIEPDAIRISGKRLEIRMKNLIVSESEMYAAGNINAVTGNIAGWKISNRNGHGYWIGSGNSRIDVNAITAQSGSAGTIKANGDVVINSTFMGNFDVINCENAIISGDITCSAFQSDRGGELTCGTLRCYTSYREPYESLPTKPSYPDKEEYSDNTKYNTNDLPYGGLVTDQCSCNRIKSSLAGKWWSDARLKEDISEVEPEKALEVLRKLRPVTYHFRSGGKRYAGYLAQEVPKQYQAETPKGYLGLRYDSISATLDALLIKYSRRLREVAV